MTARTTELELQVSRSGRMAYVILVEGIGLAFTTVEDVAGISAAWNGTAWDSDEATWLPTAFMPGSWSSQIEFFNPKIRADSISFRVLDRRDYLAGLIFRGVAGATRTFLTADVANDATSLAVQETGSFTAPGDSYVYVGNETIKVNAADKTTTGWTTVERAQWALAATDGGDPFAPAHRRNTINGAAPRVSAQPLTWFNRRVAIYAHHWEQGSTSWSAADDALLVWEGLLRNPVDLGDRSIQFTAVHVTELLNRHLLENQFTADVAAGMYIPLGQNRVVIDEQIYGSTPTRYTFDITPDHYTASALIARIRAALVPATSGLEYAWTCEKWSDGKVLWRANNHPNQSLPLQPRLSRFYVGMGRDAWTLLGFFRAGIDGELEKFEEATATFRVHRLGLGLPDIGGSPVRAIYQRVAEKTPVKYLFIGTNSGSPTQVRLENVSGTWSPQPQISLGEGIPAAVEGYMQFADMEIAGGAYDEGSKIFTIHQTTPGAFVELGYKGAGGITGDGGQAYREDEYAGTMKVRQVWYEKQPLSSLVLRLILSTGTNGYNHATYDVNPSGLAMGVPASLVDIDSFRTLGSDPWTLFVNQPTETARLLESVLASRNRYIVWRRGKLALVEPKVDGPAIAVAFSLNDNNKASRGDRVRAELAGDGIINRVELRYNRDIAGQFQAVATVDDVVSQSDFGHQRAVAVEAWGIQTRAGDGFPETLAQLAAKTLAYFSRPVVVIERTISKALIEIVAGDTVLISDPYLVDPRTGARGVTNFPAWVQSMSFQPDQQSGRVRLVYSPDFPSDKVCPWAWSARVDFASTDAGYVEVSGSSRYVQVLADEYQDSAAGAADDLAGVLAGDKIRIRELSPSDPYNPRVWQRTVESVDRVNLRIYLTTAIADWDSNLRYIVTPDTITNVVQAQRAYTYIADDTTDTTGYAANDSYVLGTPRFSIAAPLTQQGFTRPSRAASDQGHPLAVADVKEATRSINTLLSHRTRHLVLSQMWMHDAAITHGADREIVLGPVWVPLYAYGARGLKVRLFAKTSNATYPAAFRVTASRQMPQGPSRTAFNFPPPANAKDVTVTATTTTLTWLGEASLDADPEPGNDPPGTFITIDCLTGNAGGVGHLRGVCIFEGAG